MTQAASHADHINTDRVILISHGFQQHYETDFTNGLAATGLEVTLISSDMTPAHRIDPRVKLKNLRGSRDPGRSRWSKLFNLMSYHLKLLRFACKHRDQTVVIFGLCEPVLPVAIVENLILRIMGCRIYLVVHNILPHDRHTATLRLMHKVAYRIPDRLIVHSRSTAADLKTFGVDDSRMLFIEHGLNSVEPYRGSQREARLALGIDLDGPWLLMFGKIAPYKGLDLLVESMVEVPGFHLLIAGFWGDAGYRDDLKTIISERNLASRIHLIDRYIEDDEVGRLFAACDAIALPYRHIDQSGVLMLSLSLGKPALATRIGGLGDYIDRTNGDLIEAPSVEEIVKTIKIFLTRRRSFDEADVKASVERLAWSNTLALLASDIRQVP